MNSKVVCRTNMLKVQVTCVMGGKGSYPADYMTKIKEFEVMCIPRSCAAMMGRK